MEIPRFLWLGATTASIGILLIVIVLETRAERRDTTRPRFDPGASAVYTACENLWRVTLR